MKRFGRAILGLAIIALGVILALNALNITNIDIFFDGWWTLFIIVPCTVGLFTESDKTGNIIGLVIGVSLLLSCQNIISFSLIWKLFIPAIIIIIGVKLIIGGIFGNKANKIIDKLKENGKKPASACATFSKSEVNYDGEVFEGAELDAVFGCVKCDLRNAVIEKDCAIQASAVFGGIDILVPENVNIKVGSNSLFGGASNKTEPKKDVPTIYINANCIFGGVEIK